MNTTPWSAGEPANPTRCRAAIRSCLSAIRPGLEALAGALSRSALACPRGSRRSRSGAGRNALELLSAARCGGRPERRVLRPCTAPRKAKRRGCRISLNRCRVEHIERPLRAQGPRQTPCGAPERRCSRRSILEARCNRRWNPDANRSRPLAEFAAWERGRSARSRRALLGSR